MVFIAEESLTGKTPPALERFAGVSISGKRPTHGESDYVRIPLVLALRGSFRVRTFTERAMDKNKPGREGDSRPGGGTEIVLRQRAVHRVTY
jgi:hypothetical protein